MLDYVWHGTRQFVLFVVFAERRDECNLFKSREVNLISDYLVNLFLESMKTIKPIGTLKKNLWTTIVVYHKRKFLVPHSFPLG